MLLGQAETRVCRSWRAGPDAPAGLCGPGSGEGLLSGAISLRDVACVSRWGTVCLYQVRVSRVGALPPESAPDLGSSGRRMNGSVNAGYPSRTVAD